jgi:hypothetical protein
MRSSKEDGKAFVVVRNIRRSMRLNHPSDYVRKLRQLGELALLTGKPLESFYDVPDIEHNEASRMEFEKAYWGTDVELRREGH